MQISQASVGSAQIQTLFRPHEDLHISRKEKEKKKNQELRPAGSSPPPPAATRKLVGQIKPLYCHHEKHVTPDELREWHLKNRAEGYWISSPW